MNAVEIEEAVSQLALDPFDRGEFPFSFLRAFGNPETTTGGKALKFYASLRLDIRRIGPVKEKEDVIGSHVRVKVVKNKVAPPFKQAEFDIMYAEGISHTSLLVDIGAESGIIEKSGAWYSYNGQRIGQGRENAKQFLEQHPDVADAIEGGTAEGYCDNAAELFAQADIDGGLIGGAALKAGDFSAICRAAAQ